MSERRHQYLDVAQASTNKNLGPTAYRVLPAIDKLLGVSVHFTSAAESARHTDRKQNEAASFTPVQRLKAEVRL